MAAEGVIGARDCIERLADEFRLSDEERTQLMPSGHERLFYNRVHWALTYLAQARLIVRPKRAHFTITDRGRQVLAQAPSKITDQFLSRFEEYREFKSRRRPKTSELGEAQVGKTYEVQASSEATPEERIAAAYEEITTQLRTELLDKIMQSSPAFFERLIVDLMIAMGYGGSLAAAGQRVGRSGDGGIDGIINEDALGLDVVYLQAKRYAPENAVGIEKVREFAGALAGNGATKGVFVTTSYFAPSAQQFTTRLAHRLVMIDGDELTRLLVRYGVGVRNIRTIDLKKIDLDYFDELEGT